MIALQLHTVTTTVALAKKTPEGFIFSKLTMSFYLKYITTMPVIDVRDIIQCQCRASISMIVDEISACPTDRGDDRMGV